MKSIPFKEIRKYCSVLDRVSICLYETLSYENYNDITKVPKIYDEKFLYGFGIIESEFDDTFKSCIEIIVSNEPRTKQEYKDDWSL